MAHKTEHKMFINNVKSLLMKIIFMLFFPRFILNMLSSFFLVYGGFGVGLLMWVLGVWVFS